MIDGILSYDFQYWGIINKSSILQCIPSRGECIWRC